MYITPWGADTTIDGTCTCEHGVGIGKRKFMPLEHGESYPEYFMEKQVRSKNNK